MTDLSADIPRFITTPPQQFCQPNGKKSTVAQFSLGDNFVGFRGHFPTNPVVPGIVQIMLAQYTAACGEPSTLTDVIKCKFISQIKPNDRIDVRVDQVSADRAHRYTSTILANGIRSATLLFELQLCYLNCNTDNG